MGEGGGEEANVRSQRAKSQRGSVGAAAKNLDKNNARRTRGEGKRRVSGGTPATTVTGAAGVRVGGGGTGRHHRERCNPTLG